MQQNTTWKRKKTSNIKDIRNNKIHHKTTQYNGQLYNPKTQHKIIQNKINTTKKPNTIQYFTRTDNTI